MNNELKICRIHWQDANFVSGWHRSNELATELVLIQSVGWLVAETKDTVTLAQSVSPFRAGDLLVIPRNAIVEQWVMGND